MTTPSKVSGKCYCGALEYTADPTSMFKAQCHCRECQYHSGGGPNYFMLVPAAEFSYTSGAPKTFTRPDLDAPVTREFCADCGTHILTRRPNLDQVILKVGTLDDPTIYAPSAAIHTADIQPFHQVPDGLPSFERLPPPRTK